MKPEPVYVNSGICGPIDPSLATMESDIRVAANCIIGDVALVTGRAIIDDVHSHIFMIVRGICAKEPR